MFREYLPGYLATCLMTCLLAGIPTFALAASVSSEVAPRPDWRALFEARDVVGTFVLCQRGGACQAHDTERAMTPYIPSSTFKVAHTLIGLDVGAVADVDEVLPYGGGPQMFSVWEQDLPLREAMPVSSVPVYQALASRIGLPDMRRLLAELDYGNAETGEHLTRFWLDGPLMISALQQAHFLLRLASDDLPVSPEHQRAARDILLLEGGDGYALYGKTGWVFTQNEELGWWVGWVEQRGQMHAFALNIDLRQAGDADKRQSLGRAILAAEGLLPWSGAYQ
ncbi:class D beta-lactamase [Alcanivorax sp. JB21]|uniref:class D beta-lactamase n=1 Tax=Alcanivorax limicola TaxID=2874102 RepID=UPI001CBFEBB7|nr:class D beta-lactamase [Alcanivorax limicola]MBZ2190488.1 class D beta-lactamase [Alcanivorax limicola]